MQRQLFRWLATSLNSGIGNTIRSTIPLARHVKNSIRSRAHAPFFFFFQELATGKTADAAYVLAGYRANRSNAARLSASRDIQKRVTEVQSLGAERAAITVETLIAEAEAARSKAMSKKGGAAAAVGAITAKAKLAGLWREKVAQTDPSGENAPRYIISDRPMTEEEWIGSGVASERPIAGCVGLSPVFARRFIRLQLRLCGLAARTSVCEL